MIDPDRARAVRALLQQEPLDLILSDDGLQHYRLARDLELVLIDAARGLGNGRCLPAGPCVSRLSGLARWMPYCSTAPPPIPSKGMRSAFSRLAGRAEYRSTLAAGSLPGRPAVACGGGYRQPAAFLRHARDATLATDSARLRRSRRLQPGAAEVQPRAATGDDGEGRGEMPGVRTPGWSYLQVQAVPSTAFVTGSTISWRDCCPISKPLDLPPRSIASKDCAWIPNCSTFWPAHYAGPLKLAEDKSELICKADGLAFPCVTASR